MISDIVCEAIVKDLELMEQQAKPPQTSKWFAGYRAGLRTAQTIVKNLLETPDENL